MMRLLLFIVLVIAGFVLLPDGKLVDFVVEHVPVPGDGETGMDNLEMVVIGLKTLLSGIGACLLLKIVHWLQIRCQK